ncbi:MAG: carbon starvation protein A [Deltaproteobacteria bacterium]|nr:carbon starvation protein A [Deltaproteobacteria bacterium]|tara:strand:- start:726 stop:2474 length:1749 start_codon:yes stop_codon:yes gene_type:complete
MTPVLATIVAFVAYILAYRFYARFLSDKVYKLDDARPTPAHRYEDGVDYVPTKPPVLFGHHFASITGLAPMLGPAVAVIWGWLPAMLWVVCGAIFVGCVHDFSALAISLRARGLSVGKVAEGVLGPRAGLLFQLIIFFLVALAMGVFVFVISRLFSIQLAPGRPGYPQAVLPSGLLMLVAVVAGFLLYRKGLPLVPVIAVGFVLELIAIWLGMKFPTMGLSKAMWPSSGTWTWILLGYAFMASVLPVWILLQSRDFLNSLLLYFGVGLAYLGLFFGNPSFAAPAFVPAPKGAPPMLPFVFIIIACGAASGFHGLVSSGTTAKQLDREAHAKPIGYGAMVGESMLGLLAVLACTAGFSSPDVWHSHYKSWASAAGLATKIDAFIKGTTSFVSHLGIPSDIASALIAMVVVSFALTTLDSATRLLRFNIEEIGSTLKIPGSNNRYVSSALACLAIALFAFYKVGGKPAALALWQLFGTTNQLLAGLVLILATLYLRHRRWPIWFTAIPAVFIMSSTLIAMVTNLWRFAFGPQRDYLLLTIGGVLLALAIWLLVEAVLSLLHHTQTDDPEVHFLDGDEDPVTEAS